MNINLLNNFSSEITVSGRYSKLRIFAGRLYQIRLHRNCKRPASVSAEIKYAVRPTPVSHRRFRRWTKGLIKMVHEREQDNAS